MKKVLGLDIGTNSIGWAFIHTNAYENPESLSGNILRLGSRIIPMDGEAMNKFESGVPESKAAGRRQARSARRLNQRYQLRRSRLINAFKILGWVSVDFPTQFKHIPKHKISDYFPYSENLKKEAALFFKTEGIKTSTGSDYEIPEDWLIYFLKTKSLETQISLPEMARILYHYNQRRGFKSSRKDNKLEDESDAAKKQEEWIDIVEVLSIEEISKGDGRDFGKTVFKITCKSSDLEFSALLTRLKKPDWEGKKMEFKITRKITKDNAVTYNIYSVDPEAWEYRKAALEKDISNTGLFISEYYLTQIQKDRNYRIKQRVVDRKFYQQELEAIWKAQSNFYATEFTAKHNIEKIADAFYKHNTQKNKELKNKDLFHIFFNDIIYFQRGLKSQKALLADCKYEKKSYKLNDGSVKTIGKKVISKSAPCFQEFRIWQTIHNLKVIQKESLENGRLVFNIDKTDEILNPEVKCKLFELFDSNAVVTHDRILKLLGFNKDFVEAGVKTFPYKLNFPEEKDFPGNETKAFFRKAFKKANWEEKGENYIQDKNTLEKLWHIFYSLPEEKEIRNALSNKKCFDFPTAVIEILVKLPEFKPQYAAFSYKAIQKLLPLMRTGKYWEAAFDKETQERIDSLLTGEYNEKIADKVRELASKYNFKKIHDFSGLPLYAAAYIVYNRHSDTDAREKYKEASELQINKLIPYNSLRNPVVEKIVRESLKLVKDIWLDERLGRPDYIHIELSRDLKKNNEEKQEISKTNYKNKLEKDRTIALLKELKYPTDSDPSGSDVEKFKIWLESGGYAGKASFEAIFKPNKAEWISHAHVEKYRLWAEQNYISPYSGKVIPLSQLFTEKYQVDHIIPRSRYYDDSTSNKVVVEAQLNELKGNQLAIQFIENSQGQGYDVLNLTDFVSLVDKTYSNKKKRQYLKLYEVPEGFIQRQLNDTKYISRTIGKMLRPIALGTETDDGIVYTSGTITNDLKGKWGLHNLWKEILKPRFERLEGILGEPLIVGDTENPGKFRFAKDIKRIDHRHHALDALTIACTSRSHIKYLNSLNSFSNNKKDIIKYNEWAKWKYLLNKKKQLENLENGMLEFNLPWDGFYEDAREALLSVIVSHKPTSRLISKTINKYYKYVEVSPGKWEKKIHLQQNPTDEDKYWVAVRQSLFGQPYGKIKIAEYKKNVALKQAIKLQVAFLQRSEKQWATEDWRIAQTVLRKKIDFIIRQHNFDEKSILKTLTTTPLLDEAGDKIEFIDLLQFKSYASKRVSLDESFTIDKVNKIPYANHPNNWLTRLISSHLAEYENDPKLAFKGEALELLHKKSKLPISKVTRTEAGNKREINNKLLDGDKGVNQFFIVEITKKLNKKTGELETVRQYKTPDFLDCIERLAKKLPIHDENPDSQYTVLSPGDMVYVPHENENISSIDWSDQKKLADSIYIMRSSQDTKCYFLPATVASLIMYYDAKTKKGEFGSLNNSEKTWNQSQAIKSNFIKLKVDRLGYVKPD